MYLGEYDSYTPMAGSFKKRLKKAAKVAAHVGAAVATGGASLAVSAALIKAEKEKKARAAAAAQEQALVAQMMKPQPSIAPEVVTPSAGGSMPVTVAPAAPEPMMQRAVVPSSADTSYMTQPGESYGGPLPASASGLTPAGKPAWVMPALLIGGGLLVAKMMRGGGRS